MHTRISSRSREIAPQRGTRVRVSHCVLLLLLEALLLLLLMCCWPGQAATDTCHFSLEREDAGGTGRRRVQPRADIDVDAGGSGPARALILHVLGDHPARARGRRRE